MAIRQPNPEHEGGVEGEHQGLPSFRLDLTIQRRNDLKDAVTQGRSDSTGETGVQDDVGV